MPILDHVVPRYSTHPSSDMSGSSSPSLWAERKRLTSEYNFCHLIVSICNLISCGSGVLIDDRIYPVITGPRRFPDDSTQYYYAPN